VEEEAGESYDAVSYIMAMTSSQLIDLDQDIEMDSNVGQSQMSLWRICPGR